MVVSFFSKKKGVCILNLSYASVVFFPVTSRSLKGFRINVGLVFLITKYLSSQYWITDPQVTDACLFYQTNFWQTNVFLGFHVGLYLLYLWDDSFTGKVSLKKMEIRCEQMNSLLESSPHFHTHLNRSSSAPSSIFLIRGKKKHSIRNELKGKDIISF